jgi:hypothetical protein
VTSLEELRERAEEHDDELASTDWFTVADLAARWHVSQTTVRLIPADQLRYKEFGAGEKLKRRRYRGDWVAEYENASGRSDA